jgi:transcriptional regulator with XRE-family HTH domain
MKARYESAAEAAAALCGDAGVAEAVTAHARECALVTMLIGMRVAKGMTQTDVARKMGVHPSTVSKLEASADDWLRIAEVVRYARALGMGASLSFEDPALPAAERIKDAVFEIHRRLNDLAALAKSVGEDKAITDKISQFYGEVLFNFLLKFRDSHERLQTVLRLDGQHEAANASETPVQGPANAEAREPVAAVV